MRQDEAVRQNRRSNSPSYLIYLGAGLAALVVLGGLGALIGFLGHTALEPTASAPAVVLPPKGTFSATATATPLMPSPLTPTPTAPVPTTVVPTATPQPALQVSFEGPISYGTSVQGRPLLAYRLGNGSSARAIVGAIHGGYEWNTVNVVSDTLVYFLQHREQLPPDVTLYLIPCANPDGYAAGTDAVVARMNANGVDLNRNWDYEWQPTATHGSRPVSAGTAAFSEPETAALRDFIQNRQIGAVIFYHSAMGKVFSGAGRDQSATFDLAELLADTIGYEHQTEGVPGQITTGDAIDYLSVQGIAAAEVELTTHALIGPAEWGHNLDGILAFVRWQILAGPTIAPPPDLNSGEWELESYTVQPRDTLSDIALAYGVPLETLMTLNGIINADQIQAGQVITVPVRRSPGQ